MLVCDNEACQQPVCVAGRGCVEHVQTGPYEDEYIDSYYPEYMNPSPALIRLPRDCPQEVSDELAKAFISSWGDFPASANRIRVTVERLLDSLKQRKTRTIRKGKRERLALHDRILGMPAKYKALTDPLLAIKWLGNVGSHTDKITRDDVFDALDILEHVLEELFDKHRRKLRTLVQAINKEKGPAKKRSRKGPPKLTSVLLT